LFKTELTELSSADEVSLKETAGFEPLDLPVVKAETAEESLALDLPFLSFLPLLLDAPSAALSFFR